MLRALVLALSLLAAEALFQPACCASRLSVSRVAVRRAALCMCDAEAAEPVAEAAPVEAAEAPAEEAPKPRRERKAKTPLTELEAGAEVEGKIRSVMTDGAFVDIGAPPPPSPPCLLPSREGRFGGRAARR